jgi:hypothetical protein
MAVAFLTVIHLFDGELAFQGYLVLAGVISLAVSVAAGYRLAISPRRFLVLILVGALLAVVPLLIPASAEGLVGGVLGIVELYPVAVLAMMAWIGFLLGRWWSQK